MNARFQLKTIIVALVLLVGIVGLKSGVAALPSNLSTVSTVKEVSSARNTYVVQAVKKVNPAVVGITNRTYALDEDAQKILVDKGVGSGVIFDANGYIVTNNHVVEGARELVVSLASGKTLKGRVVGADALSDLAVVKVDAANLPVAHFGDSDSLMPGEPAIAIGNPLGMEFQGSVTVGIISALNRTIEIDDRRIKLIQTDAAINPGNSGGALVNADGDVIGINSIKVAVAGVEGMGFAIPINFVRPILQSLIEKGHVIRAHLGVNVLDHSTASQYGYLKSAQGVYVVSVVPDGPAVKAGVLAGDIILKISNVDINSIADIHTALDKSDIGSVVAVTILRKGKEMALNVIVQDMEN